MRDENAPAKPIVLVSLDCTKVTDASRKHLAEFRRTRWLRPLPALAGHDTKANFVLQLSPIH